jgi:uncharacterized protein (DUF1684 family)
MNTVVLGVCVASVLFAGCMRDPALPAVSPADSLHIVRENLNHRLAKDESFRTDPDSPFRRDTSVAFLGLRWFPVDPRYRVTSVLHRHADPDTVVVLGTKGEPRKQLRYGYFEFVLPDEYARPVTVRLQVYKVTPYDTRRYALYKDYLNIWFTDRTTGKETYHVGRYLELGPEHPDPEYAYTLDFNMAFNPYCAYSSLFSCAVPRDEDRLALALRVGEMTYAH